MVQQFTPVLPDLREKPCLRCTLVLLLGTDPIPFASFTHVPSYYLRQVASSNKFLVLPGSTCLSDSTMLPRRPIGDYQTIHCCTALFRALSFFFFFFWGTTLQFAALTRTFALLTLEPWQLTLDEIIDCRGDQRTQFTLPIDTVTILALAKLSFMDFIAQFIKTRMGITASPWLLAVKAEGIAVVELGNPLLQLPNSSKSSDKDDCRKHHQNH